MCGIAGIWNWDSTSVAAPDLSVMNKALSHRGPDDQGTWLKGSLGITHRRLSILDLSSAGRQPMATADGRYVLVFNGEIYNFRELSNQFLLTDKLKSRADTEVLLRLLVIKGADALPLLRGMFALAFWDSIKQELLLARDPLGKKPLFYAQTDQQFLFGSEPKALLAVQPQLACLDEEIVAKYLLYEYPLSPASGFRDIQQVPAGSSLTVAKRKLTSRRYWQAAFLPKSRVSSTSVVKTVDRLLRQAVARRMIADVPVGLFLSGGLDSSTVGWYMRQETKAPLHSFSVAFDDDSFDESRYAEMVAEKLGFEHHVLKFTLEDFRKMVPAVMSQMDVPLADISLLPTFAVSQMARSYVTVALDGDGSDEIFGGYGTFTAAAAAARLSFLPPFVIRLMEHGAAILPISHRYFSLDFKLKSFLKGLPYAMPRRNQVWLGSFSDRELQEFLMPRWQVRASELYQELDAMMPSMRFLSTADQVSRATLEHYLKDDILVKLDRATMLNSLEARTPFLDVDLLNYVTRLPARCKKNKNILKGVMRGRLPREIIQRRKQGFGVPSGRWFQRPLYPWLIEVLDSEKVGADGFWRPDAVQRILAEHRNGQADHRKKIWTLVCWQLWYDHWIARRPVSAGISTPNLRRLS